MATHRLSAKVFVQNVFSWTVGSVRLPWFCRFEDVPSSVKPRPHQQQCPSDIVAGVDGALVDMSDCRYTGDGGFVRPSPEKIPRQLMKVETGAVRVRRTSFQRTSSPRSMSCSASLAGCAPPVRGVRRQMTSANVQRNWALIVQYRMKLTALLTMTAASQTSPRGT